MLTICRAVANSASLAPVAAAGRFGIAVIAAALNTSFAGPASQRYDPATVRAAISDIAATSLYDGVIFDTQAATAAAIREEAQYQAVRVRMTASLATARPSFHVDVRVGDPITPEPRVVQLPRILGGTIAVRDMYTLSARHPVDGTELTASTCEVAQHRGARLTSLGTMLDGYGAIGQRRWEAWWRNNALRTACQPVW